MVYRRVPLQNLLLQNEVQYVSPFSKKSSKKSCRRRETLHKKYAQANKTAFFSIHLCILTFLWIKILRRSKQKTKRTAIHDATRSGVSASTDNKAVCTLPTQVSNRSRSDIICEIPKTLGWTQETWIVPSTWLIIPSIRWTCSKFLYLTK